MRKKRGRKAALSVVFCAGWAAGTTVASGFFMAGVPLEAILAAAFAALAVCVLSSRGERRAESARSFDRAPLGDAARPRKASTAQAPRDFNPRQAAVDELARACLLTPREKEVLEFLARGRDVQFISESLVLSPNTVRTHVYRVFGKLDVHGRQELIDAVERACDACLLSRSGDAAAATATGGRSEPEAEPESV